MSDRLATVAVLPDAQRSVLAGRREAAARRLGQYTDGIDKVCVRVACLYTLARCEPALDGGVVGTGQELFHREDGEPPHTVGVT